MTAPLSACAEAPNFKGWDQAGSQAYYACRYFSSVEDTNFARNVIAGIQAATQIVFATNQYNIAKQAQDRLDNISNIELARSGLVFDQFTKVIACEDALRAEACAAKVAKPDINDVRRRISAEARRIFAPLKQKIRQCFAPSCAAAACVELNKLARAEATAVLSGVNQYYQFELTLYEQRVATAKSWAYQMVTLGRGAIAPSTALLQGSAQNANLAGNINPYSGWIQAVNGIANTARSISLQEANSFGGMGINMRQQRAMPTASGVTVSQSPQQPSNMDTYDSYDFQGQPAMPYGQSATGLQSNGDVYDSYDLQDQEPNFLGTLSNMR